MRIGQMTSMMRMVSNNQKTQAATYTNAQKQISTGKRVNSAADDPSAIGRIARTKADLSASKIRQASLSDAKLRNTTMENSLDFSSDATHELNKLAVSHSSPGVDRGAIEKQATDLLDSMVDTMANTEYNGSNPFTQGKINIGLSNGGSLELDAPKFNIKKNVTDPTTYDIIKADGTTLSGQSVEDILDSDFIETNLTNEIADAKSKIGVSDNIINFRQNHEAKQEVNLTSQLSQMEDADLAEVAVDAAMAKTMMDMNQGLLGVVAQNGQQQIGSILNMIM